jgi:hypothetical protein
MSVCLAVFDNFVIIVIMKSLMNLTFHNSVKKKLALYPEIRWYVELEFVGGKPLPLGRSALYDPAVEAILRQWRLSLMMHFSEAEIGFVAWI